jgi:hypothetical protein
MMVQLEKTSREILLTNYSKLIDEGLKLRETLKKLNENDFFYQSWQIDLVLLEYRMEKILEILIENEVEYI